MLPTRFILLYLSDFLENVPWSEELVHNQESHQEPQKCSHKFEVKLQSQRCQKVEGSIDFGADVVKVKS